MNDERKTKAQLIAELSELRQRTVQPDLSRAVDVLGRVNDGFVALDRNWRYAYVNQRAAEILNRQRPEDLIGRHIWTEYPEGVGQPFHLAYEKALAEQQTIVLEDYYPPWDRWFENRIYPSPDGLTIYFTEITARKRTENELRKKNRDLVTLSACNQALVRLADERELLNEICRICIEIGGYRLAWVGYAELDEQKTVRPVAQYGFERDYLDTANITWADNERGRGPTGTAIRTRQTRVVRRIPDDPAYMPWRAAALQHGYAASIALPLMIGDQVVGALNIYAADPEAFDAAEVKLLQELASDLAYGIASVRTCAEHARVEEALKVSEARYRLISTVASDYVFSTRLDSAGRLVLDWVAGAFEAMTEYSYAEYVAHGGWRAALHPDDLAVDDRDMDQLRHNQPVISELRTLTKSGKVVWVRVYAHPVWDEHQHALAGIYGAVQNITERKQTEAALQASERQLSLIYANISDVLFYLAVEPDDCFRFVSVNSAFLKATGLTEDQIVGKLVQEVIPEPAQALVLENYKKVIWTKKAVGWEEVSVYPAGQKYGEVSVIPILDANGNCTHLIGTVHDITERKQAAEKISKLNAELELRVIERTDELRRSNEQLRLKNEELKAFAYTVSHDLKAPLRGIAGYAQELDRRHRAGLSERGQFCVNQIMAATRNLDQLIEDLLHYSRLDAETPTVTNVHVRELIEAILSDRRPLIFERGTQVSIDLPFDTLRCWERGLTQVLTNLIDNAIKYSRHAAPPKITITGEELAHAYRLRIGDNGIGFDMKYHDRIYGLFNRLVRQSEFEGTGAGLAIARKALDKQGGRIWAESQPGAGAVFFVELPKVSTPPLQGSHA